MPSASRPRTAVILAAGLGARLRATHSGPKRLLEFAGQKLLPRSRRLVAEVAGGEQFVLVIGGRGEDYRTEFRYSPRRVCFLENAAFATTGSLHSLGLAIAETSGDAWLLEYDLLYEPRAFTGLLAIDSPDAVLASGPTASSDEVWLCADDAGRPRQLNKQPLAGRGPFGELVGISRLSRASLTKLALAGANLPPAADYEDAFNTAATDELFLFRDAVNEGDAVVFQNSGLGNAVNALNLLGHLFRVPLLLVVTHRGAAGGRSDEPQHELMGEITRALLDMLRMPWAPFPRSAGETEIALGGAAGETKRPSALLLRAGVLPPPALAARPVGRAIGRRVFSFSEELRRNSPTRTTRTEALRAIRGARKNSEAQDSTGAQPTVSRGVALAAVAQARAVSTDTPAELAPAMAAQRTTGPLFVHFLTRAGAPALLLRPSVPPAAVSRRLQRWLRAA